MEKIYMEENQQQQQQQSQKQQKGLYSFSIVLSFAVAIFALFTVTSFGLVMFIGNHGGISYAAPISGDNFTFRVDDISVQSLGTGGSPTVYYVPIYYADGSSDVPVFCIQHHVAPDYDHTYKKDGPIDDDYGLLYLLNDSFANGKSNTAATGANAKYVESWVTQTAIWLYLYEKNPSESTNSLAYHDDETDYTSEEVVNMIKSTMGLRIGNSTYSESTNLYTKYVKPLVDEAKNQSNLKQLSVEINSDDPASIAEDNSFYLSPVATLRANPADDLTGVEITFSGVEGAILVDKSGNEIDASNLKDGSEFRVKIPANKVDSSKTITVGINAKGSFSTLAGHYFVAANNPETHQKVVTVTGATSDISAGATFEIIPTPPTGMNAAQTIYFIGLIVLLCGVGIVYANAKPIENKQ